MKSDKFEIGDRVVLKDLELFKSKEPLDNLQFLVVNFGGNFAFITDTGQRIWKIRMGKIKKI